jgi:hypothetical protein
MRSYMNGIRAKSNRYRQAKMVLQAMLQEVPVLERTRQILTERERDARKLSTAAKQKDVAPVLVRDLMWWD